MIHFHNLPSSSTILFGHAAAEISCTDAGFLHRKLSAPATPDRAPLPASPSSFVAKDILRDSLKSKGNGVVELRVDQGEVRSIFSRFTSYLAPPTSHLVLFPGLHWSWAHRAPSTFLKTHGQCLKEGGPSTTFLRAEITWAVFGGRRAQNHLPRS